MNQRNYIEASEINIKTNNQMNDKFPGLYTLLTFQNVFFVLFLTMGLLTTFDGMMLSPIEDGWNLVLRGLGFLVLALLLRLCHFVVRIFLEIEKNTRKE